MNRQSIWIHLTLAITLIVVAALVGQVRRWESSQAKQEKPLVKTKACAMSRSATESEPEVLVKFRSKTTPQEIQRLVARQNDRIEDAIEALNDELVAVDDLDNRSPEQIVEEYRRLSEFVEYAEPNRRIAAEPITLEENSLLAGEDGKSSFNIGEDEKENLPNDPLFGVQWALRNIGQNNGKEKADLNALKAWAKTKGNSEVVIAVLDSGVDYTHQDLITNIWERPEALPPYKDNELGVANDLHGFNAADNNRDPMDDNGHGTHCAGILGADGNNGEGIAGMNWSIKIMPLKFLGRGGFGTTKDAIEAINYAIERKRAGVNIRVISASWGSTAYSRALEDIIRKAGEEGILFVAAAGNASTNNDNSPHYPSSYKLPNVISVAATDRNDQLASFSNFGTKSVHVAAPGKEIMSTWLKGQYREASGTSMATPYVSGVAGLILAVEPDLSIEKLRERLLKAVDKQDVLNGKVESGGRLNAAKAVGE